MPLIFANTSLRPILDPKVYSIGPFSWIILEFCYTYRVFQKWRPFLKIEKKILINSLMIWGNIIEISNKNILEIGRLLWQTLYLTISLLATIKMQNTILHSYFITNKFRVWIMDPRMQQFRNSYTRYLLYEISSQIVTH